MLKNAKAKGARRERQVIDLLECFGYSCCKSGGSLGVWDVIAIGPADVLLVQVKSNRLPPPDEMERMRQFIVPKGVKKWVYIIKDGGDIRTIQL